MVLTNLHKYYKQPEILPPIGSSDHNVILLTSKTTKPKGIKSRILIRDTCNANRQLFSDKLKTANFTPVLYETSCEQKYELFHCILNGVIDETLPFKSLKSYSLDKPWVSAEIKQAIVQRQKIWKLFGPQSPEFRSLRNKINQLVKKAKKRYLNDKIKQCGNLNSRQWWKEVKSLAGMNNNHQVSSILYNGRLIEGVELANHINNCFVLTTTNISELYVQPTITEVPDRYRVSVDEVELKLSQVKSCKAVGPDDFPNWILRDFSNILSLPLCSIFNASIEEACLQRIWKSADVIPSPKIVPVKDAATDLRPISLTPVMSKIGESLIYKWLLESIEDRIDPYQFGEIKNSCTTDALMFMIHIWFQALT